MRWCSREHLPALRELAARYPELVDGARSRRQAADRRRANLARPGSATSPRSRARRPCVCKFSGLVTEAGSADPPVLARVLSITCSRRFGPQRLMWGSDWPVCELVCSYEQWRRPASMLVVSSAPPEREQISFGTCTDDLWNLRRLAGKTAVVTAAGSGIGRASARSVRARRRARVRRRHRRAGAADRRRLRGPRRSTCAIRPRSPRSRRSSGRIDVLFNCAGIGARRHGARRRAAAWNAAFDLNVNSMFHMIRAFLPGMIEARAGSIINMSSVAGSITGVPDRCAYGATKAAVIGLTKSVAADFVAQGMRCNAICPGTVDTPSLQARLHAYGDYAKTRAEFEARQPMGRLGKPEEIAALALHLASDESGFTTGQIHVIDGGWMI